MDKTVKTLIHDQIVAMVTDLSAAATFRTMYGGTVIEMREKDPKSGIGGIFAYEGYVSVEFAKGVELDDPQGVLEGSGKKRRHVKLRGLDDIDARDCRAFLSQAIALV